MKNRSPLVVSLLAATVLFWWGLSVPSGAFGQDAENGTWLTDFALALETAAKQGKDIFIHFTGSDWCGFCIAMHDQVLTKPSYTERAGKSFVLVEVDFPRNKPQSAELKKHNELLRGKFAIKGYPTLLLADSLGRAYSRIPNQPGIIPDQLASQMESLQSIRKRRDDLLKEADKLQGMERAEKLNDALGSMDDELAGRYHADIVDQIIELDEKDKLKWKNKRKFSKAMDEIQSRIQTLARANDHEGITRAVDEFVEKKELKGEQKQRALMLKLGLYGAGELAAAADFLSKIIEIASDSDTGREAAEIRMRLNEYIAEDQPQSVH